MNIPYLLKIKYLLGLTGSKEIFDWAYNQSVQIPINNRVLDLLFLKDDNHPAIIGKLSEIASLQTIDKSEVKKYFYPLFIQVFQESGNIISLERLLLKFYSLVRDDIGFSEDENLSFSIIANDLSLRESSHPFQITESTILQFLKNDRQVGD